MGKRNKTNVFHGMNLSKAMSIAEAMSPPLEIRSSKGSDKVIFDPLRPERGTLCVSTHRKDAPRHMTKFLMQALKIR